MSPKIGTQRMTLKYPKKSQLGFGDKKIEGMLLLITPSLKGTLRREKKKEKEKTFIGIVISLSRGSQH